MKKLISLILCGLLLFSLVSCEKNQDEITISEKDTTSETTTQATPNTTSTTIESIEETTLDIVTQTNIDFDEWSISQQFYQNKYTITNVINDIILYCTCDNSNVYNIMEETNYIINLDLEYYNIYHSDNNYLYGYHEIITGEFTDDGEFPNYILEFIKYNYKENKGKTYTVDMGNYYDSIGDITYYNGYTYVVASAYKNTEDTGFSGLLKIDESSNVTLIPSDVCLGWHYLFVYNEKLYIEPYWNRIFEVTKDDKAVQIENSEFHEEHGDPMTTIYWKYYKANCCFESYNLDKNFTIYCDDDKHTLFIKNMLNNKATKILTNTFYTRLHGIKINDNKHCIVVKDDKIKIYIIEKKRL